MKRNIGFRHTFTMKDVKHKSRHLQNPPLLFSWLSIVHIDQLHWFLRISERSRVCSAWNSWKWMSKAWTWSSRCVFGSSIASRTRLHALASFTWWQVSRLLVGICCSSKSLCCTKQNFSNHEQCTLTAALGEQPENNGFLSLMGVNWKLLLWQWNKCIKILLGKPSAWVNTLAARVFFG